MRSGKDSDLERFVAWYQTPELGRRNSSQPTSDRKVWPAMVCYSLSTLEVMLKLGAMRRSVGADSGIPSILSTLGKILQECNCSPDSSEI